MLSSTLKVITLDHALYISFAFPSHELTFSIIESSLRQNLSSQPPYSLYLQPGVSFFRLICFRVQSQTFDKSPESFSLQGLQFSFELMCQAPTLDERSNYAPKGNIKFRQRTHAGRGPLIPEILFLKKLPIE